MFSAQNITCYKKNLRGTVFFTKYAHIGKVRTHALFQTYLSYSHSSLELVVFLHKNLKTPSKTQKRRCSTKHTHTHIYIYIGKGQNPVLFQCCLFAHLIFCNSWFSQHNRPTKSIKSQLTKKPQARNQNKRQIDQPRKQTQPSNKQRKETRQNKGKGRWGPTTLNFAKPGTKRKERKQETVRSHEVANE